MPHHLINRKINLQRAYIKANKTFKVINRRSRLMQFTELSSQNSKWYSVDCMASTCLYACLTPSYEMTDGVLANLPQDPDQDIAELPDRLDTIL